MGWATTAIERLRRGETVTLRPRGRSMEPKVHDGETVTVAPLGDRTLRVGDIVLCKVRGREYLHLIKKIRGTQYLIGNNRGGENGWITRASIFGIRTETQE